MDNKESIEPGRTLPEIVAEAGAELESGLDDHPYSQARLQILFGQLTEIATYLTKFAAYLKKRI
jgi:hypothetical protein